MVNATDDNDDTARRWVSNADQRQHRGHTIVWGTSSIVVNQHPAMTGQQHCTCLTHAVFQSLTWPANPHGLEVADTHQGAD